MSDSAPLPALPDGLLSVCDGPIWPLICDWEAAKPGTEAGHIAGLLNAAITKAIKDYARAAVADAVQRERADTEVMRHQIDSLRGALLKVLNTREKEAKAHFAYQTASDNYTGGAALESRRHLAAMTAASDAEREARILLLTLRPAAAIRATPAPTDTDTERKA